MDYKLLLDSVVMAGEILLESGAETCRVEDTMLRMLRMSKLKTADVLAITTGFVVTLDDPSMDSMTVMKSVESRAMDLRRIDAVNQLSRDFCDNRIDVDELFHKVRELYREHLEPKANLLPMMATTSGFTLMFGAGIWEAIAAAAAGLISGIGMWGCQRTQMHSFLKNGISAFLVAVTAILLCYFIPGKQDLNVIIIGSIMPLVPGVAITNAVYDTLHGDYISGAARTLEAFVTAASIALGVGLGMVLLKGFLR
ncbi:MAG: threonine/serine exporter ThrE family protein [Fusicatenibacter sp.]|nr:threonine/serine exporter family protein [Fusicatenibacter sp.]